MIARAADDKCFVAMASLEMSMAFGLVNTELLIKRLKVMGFPMDLIKLIRKWLIGRSYYVQIGEECCTPKQIMFYTQAINLHKIINHPEFPEYLDQVSLIDQTICTRRQLCF